MSKNIEILIIDDEKDICEQISGLLNDNSYSTITAHNSDDALEKFKYYKPKLVILDIWLNNSKLDGFKALEEITVLNDDVPIIMISGHGNIETAVKSIKQGAFDFIEKPFDSELLIFKVTKAIENANLRMKLKKFTKENFDFKFVHNSPSTEKLNSLIEKIARTESSILLSGPAGSGKEIIAKTIHKLSNRSNKTFEILSCANLNSDDFEKKLFGEKGNKKILNNGIIKKINGGTLLLDQVEDMPIDYQGKIIRFLEDQKHGISANSISKNVNLRIISTTKVDLMKLIKEKKFREDLFFKLNVVPIEIPPLDERKGDIKELCQIFIKEFTLKNNLKYKLLTEDTINYFKSASFSGNIRQLKNLVEWIIIMLSDNNNEKISYNILPEEIKLYLNNTNDKNMLSSDFSEFTLKTAKEIFEKKYIEHQILKFNFNITKVSKFIGMERTALYRKIKSLKISLTK
jgi:two-component system, NtrC family, nitrogen regulation response regulator NtrX